jgi:hypothetical protein
MDIVMLRLLQMSQRRKAVLALAASVGIALGAAIGLAVGWWLWPVAWENATPADLRSDFQRNYVGWVAKQYEDSEDLKWVQRTLGVEFWADGQLAETLDRLVAEESDAQSAMELIDLKESLLEAASEEAVESEYAPTSPLPAQATAAVPSPTSPAATDLSANTRSVASVCGVAVLVAAAVGGAILLYVRWRGGRMPGAELDESTDTERERLSGADKASAQRVERPLAQYPTTYTLGDDHYDPSFSIELESGEFLGECGIGIAETVGTGAPSKVTAFEVWLFDKNDIRTVTKVLMSDHAFNDEALRTKLAPKGEPVLANEGEEFTLETKSLRMRARVLQSSYGTGNVPQNSFFEQLTSELVVWASPETQEGAAQSVPDFPSLPPDL